MQEHVDQNTNHILDRDIELGDIRITEVGWIKDVDNRCVEVIGIGEYPDANCFRVRFLDTGEEYHNPFHPDYLKKLVSRASYEVCD